MQADIFVLYSRYEGLSHTLIEVQTLGTVAVASAVCGNPEVVADEQTGRLVSPDEPEKLTHVLAELLDDPDQRALLARNGVEAAGRFCRRETFTSVEKALLKAAEAASSGPGEG